MAKGNKMLRKAGVTVTGLVLALVMGGSVAAVADGDGSGKNPKPSASAHKSKESGDQWLADLAKRYNVTEERLESALRDIKIALGDQGKKPTDPAVVAGLAKALGISQVDASRLIKEVFMQAGTPGGKKPGKPGVKKTTEEGGQISPAVLAGALAKEFGIPLDNAKKLIADLDELSRDHGNNADDARFAAVAKSLGITPERLADGLKKVKQSMDGAEKPEPASPKPNKS
jgi:hypothetical protein